MFKNKKSVKKMLAMLIVLTMVFSTVPVCTAASDNSTTVIKGAILYTIEDGVLDYNVVYDGDVTNAKVNDTTKNKINSVAKLDKALGTPDDLGDAIVADLLIQKGAIKKITIKSVTERPVVGISWKKDTIGSDYLGFAEAYERNGAEAVFLPQVHSAAEAREVLATVDGIFMTGGEDWNPALYGEEAYPHGSSGWNDARDTSDINLMQQAIALDVPMLAVCRGEQGFNVAMGGGLIQDVPTYLGQQVKAGKIDMSRVTELEDTGIGWGANKVLCDPAHYRVVVDGLIHSGGTGYHELAAGINGNGIDKKSKWMYDIVGDKSIDLIATAHHQSANPEKLGNGITVAARSSDGIIEAIEYKDATFALGIQFHPERDALGDTRGVDVDQDTCNAFLRALVEYAGVHDASDND